MKFFDCDWNQIFRWLPVWEKLSPHARLEYLSASSHAQPILAEQFRDELHVILDHGLVERFGINRVKPASDCIQFRRIMRQLALFPLFDTNNLKNVLDDYTRKHFLSEELYSALVNARQISSEDQLWLEHFLNAPNVAEWEKPLRTRDRPAGGYRGWQFRPIDEDKWHTYVSNEEVGLAAQHLVRCALDAPGPLPMLRLADLLPEHLRPHLEPAFKAALRYRLVYPALRSDTAQPVFWVHPDIGYLAHRPAIERPRGATVIDSAAPAILPGDMAVVLGEAATGECRLKRGGAIGLLYAKVEAKMLSELPTLPAWLEKRFPPAVRLREALSSLVHLEFVTSRRGAEQSRVLEPTDAGLAWLRQPPQDRLRDLILEFHRPRKPNQPSTDTFQFRPGQPRYFTTEAGTREVRRLLERIWGEAAGESLFSLFEFVDFHARESHPLKNSQLGGADVWDHSGYRPQPLNDAQVEELWGEELKDFFWKRLVHLGAVDTGLDSDQQLCFRLNSIGDFLLGRIDQMAVAQSSDGGGVIVQPNFEIVFLQPNASAEVDVSLFGERLGKGVGTLFRITRRAIIRAAATGWSANQVLSALAQHLSKEIPANVDQEIRAWFRACRRLPLRRTWLIETPDPETAVVLQKQLGESCHVVTDCLVEYRGETIEPSARKALAELGLFLGAPPQTHHLESPEADEV